MYGNACIELTHLSINFFLFLFRLLELLKLSTRLKVIKNLQQKILKYVEFLFF